MAMSGNVRSLNGAALAGRTPSANRILRYKTNRDGLARSCLLSSSSRFLPFSGRTLARSSFPFFSTPTHCTHTRPHRRPQRAQHTSRSSEHSQRRPKRRASYQLNRQSSRINKRERDCISGNIAGLGRVIRRLTCLRHSEFLSTTSSRSSLSEYYYRRRNRRETYSTRERGSIIGVCPPSIRSSTCL